MFSKWNLISNQKKKMLLHTHNHAMQIWRAEMKGNFCRVGNFQFSTCRNCHLVAARFVVVVKRFRVVGHVERKETGTSSRNENSSAERRAVEHSILLICIPTPRWILVVFEQEIWNFVFERKMFAALKQRFKMYHIWEETLWFGFGEFSRFRRQREIWHFPWHPVTFNNFLILLFLFFD